MSASTRRESKRKEAEVRNADTTVENRRRNRQPNFLERRAGVKRLTNAEAKKLKLQLR